MGTCAVGNIYDTEYCCNSMTNSACSINNYQSTTCSVTFYVSNVCQACPTFCSNIGTCAIAATLQSCTPTCQANTVYYSGVSSCLSCDVSCQGCTQPFSNTNCLNCAYGYTMVGGSCTKCDITC